MFTGFLVSFASHGQSLSQALEQAWSRHSQAGALNARMEQAQAQAELSSALTPAAPSLSLSNATDRLNARTGKDAWELELAVPLWLPGQSAARVAESNNTAAEVVARRAALRLQLAGELRDAWWAVGAARYAVNLAGRREGAARALASDVVRRFKAGELARVDANLAQNEQLAAESELLESQSVLRQAEQTYRLLTGVEAPAVLTQEVSAAGLVDESTHPQLAAAQAVAELAQARLNVAEKTRRDAPELALRLVRDRGDFSAAYANSIGVKLTLPFSSGARVQQDRSVAQIEVAQTQAELILARQRVLSDQTRARLDVEVAQQQLVKAQARMALTADNLALVEKSFAMGESDLSTLLRSRSAAFETETFVARQQIAYFLGVSRLNQSLGVSP